MCGEAGDMATRDEDTRSLMRLSYGASPTTSWNFYTRFMPMRSSEGQPSGRLSFSSMDEQESRKSGGLRSARQSRLEEERLLGVAAQQSMARWGR